METNFDKTDETGATASNPQGSTRRNFLKGTTLALPAVVTLHSGAALAATSIGCGGNRAAEQAYTDVLTAKPHSDNRLRAPVALYKKLVFSGGKWSVGGGNGYYFKGKNGGADVWRYATNADNHNVGDLVVIGINNELGAVQRFAGDADSLGNANKMKTTRIKYAIVHVDTLNNGNFVAIGLPVGTNNNNTWICTSWTGACLTSLYGFNA